MRAVPLSGEARQRKGCGAAAHLVCNDVLLPVADAAARAVRVLHGHAAKRPTDETRDGRSGWKPGAREKQEAERRRRQEAQTRSLWQQCAGETRRQEPAAERRREEKKRSAKLKAESLRAATNNAATLL